MLRPLIRALPSVIEDTEKVLREADGSVELVVVRPHADGKVIAPGCVSKPSRRWRRARRSQALRQNQAYNPFSTTSKKMIQDVGNVELFELFETDPKTQCTECLSYWSEGIVYCTCGQLLKAIVANRGFIEYTLDLLSIPEDVIKKGRPHGHRYGKAPEKKNIIWSII